MTTLDKIKAKLKELRVRYKHHSDPMYMVFIDALEKQTEALENDLLFQRMRRHGLRAEVRALGIEIMESNPNPQPGDRMQISTARLKDLVSVAEDAAYIVNKQERSLAETAKLLGVEDV